MLSPDDVGRVEVSPERVGTTVGAAYGLVALASSAAAVVVPSIRDEFDLSLAVGSWVITAFVVALAASAPIYGRVADRLGTRTPATVGIGLMAAGALIAAAAPDTSLLLLGRALQGAGAGAIPVLAPAIIAARTSEADRPRALTRMSALAAAAAAGLLLGAVLSEFVGWRPVIALPAIAVALIPAVRHLGLAKAPPTGRLDVPGAIAVAAIAVGVILALQVRTNSTTAAVGAILIAGGLVGGRWVWRHTAEPFLPASVVRRPITWHIALAAGTIPAAYFALLIAIPTVLTERHAAGRITIGLLLFPAALSGAAVGPLAKRLRRSLSGRQIASVGLGVSAMALLGTAASVSFPVGMAVSFAAVTVSFGLGQAALLDLLTSATPPPERGAALAVFMVVFFVGGAMGATLLTTLADSTTLPVAVTILAVLPALAAGVIATTSTRAV